MTQNAQPCTGPECDRFADTLGLCRGHYQQKYRGQELRPLKQYRRNIANPPLCQAPGGCDRPVRSRGLCTTHYRRLKTDIPLDLPIDYRKSRTTDRDPRAPREKRISPAERGCLVDGCTNEHRAKGYCRFHWYRLKNGIPLDLPVNHARTTNPYCTHDDCNEPHYAKGYCSKHYMAARRTPAAPRPKTVKAAKPKVEKTKQPRKPASNLPTNWDTKPKTTPNPKTRDLTDDSILWDLMPDHEWTDLATKMRDKLTAWGDLDLADLLGVAA